MDYFDRSLQAILAPFIFPFISTQRIFFLYLLSAAFMAYFVYKKTNGSGKGQDSKGFLKYLFPKDIYSQRSTHVDIWYFFINKILFFLIVAPVLLRSRHVSSWVDSKLSSLFASPAWQLPSPWIGMAIFTLLFVLTYDFGVFFMHYLQHKIPLLWQFHKVHHSATALTPITLYRMHPVDDILAALLVVLLTGTVGGLYSFVFQEPGVSIKVAGLNIIVFLYYLLGYNLRHSHVWISYGPFLSKLLISPAQHQIHHSSKVEHHDKNFGLIFSFWDQLFGTLVTPKSKLELDYGLTNNEEKEFSSVWKLYSLPFKKCVGMYTKGKATQ